MSPLPDMLRDLKMDDSRLGTNHPSVNFVGGQHHHHYYYYSSQRGSSRSRYRSPSPKSSSSSVSRNTPYHNDDVGVYRTNAIERKMLSNYDVKWETGHLKDKARAAEAENAKELEKQMVELKKSEKVKELEKELETLKRAEKEKEKELEKKLEEVRKRERERYLSLLHTDVLVEEVNARREEKAKKKKAAEEEKDRAKWDRRVDIVMYERNKRRSLERESECGRSAWKRWR